MKLIKFTDKLENYELMYKWCCNDFIYEWFEQRKLTLNEIIKKYKSKIELGKQDLFFLNYDDKNNGFVQIYKYEDNCINGLEKYKNIYEYDIFIGEEKYLSKGLGSQFIMYIDDFISNNYNADCIILRPFKKNTRAIKCYQKSGFNIVQEYDGIDTLGNSMRYVVLIKELKK